MNWSPRVSVLLPVRDAADTLAQCLESLARQTLTHHEVVAVDDGSVDATAQLLEAARRADPRVRVIHTLARGLVPALNTGLAEARAPLLARMDADDEAAPERLEAQERGMDAAGVDVLGSRVELFGGLRGNAGMQRYVTWQNELLTHAQITRELFVESPLAHPSVMLRTCRLRDLAGWVDDDAPEDYDLWLRAHAAGWLFGKLPQVLLRWRDHSRRLTRQDPRYSAAAFQRCKLKALLAGPLADPARDVVVWGAGPTGKSWSRALSAAARRVAAFVEVDPRKLGQRIHAAPVLGVADAPGRGPLHLAAVSGSEARARIRDVTAAAGLTEGLDLIAVA
jgi:glycosyltransferase involved in cell wall biosynthesis